MTREEITIHYEKLCFQYETIMSVLKQRNLVDLDFAEEQEAKFYANLGTEKEFHFGRLRDVEESLKWYFRNIDATADYVSLTDIVKKYIQESLGYVIQSWRRSKNTMEYLRIWELINNRDFNDAACMEILEKSSKGSFTITPTKWINNTNAIGIRLKRGKGGSVKAHPDIASDFKLWLDPNFRYHLIWYVRKHPRN